MKDQERPRTKAKDTANDDRGTALRSRAKNLRKAKARRPERLSRFQAEMLLDDRDRARFAFLRRQVDGILELPSTTDQIARFVDWQLANHLNRKRLVTLAKFLANREPSVKSLLVLFRKLDRLDVVNAKIAAEILQGADGALETNGAEKT